MAAADADIASKTPAAPGDVDKGKGKGGGKRAQGMQGMPKAKPKPKGFAAEARKSAMAEAKQARKSRAGGAFTQMLRVFKSIQTPTDT